MLFADVIVPLALNRLLTYSVPSSLEGKVVAGMRVKVNIGKKSYTGLVRRVHSIPPTFETKDLVAALEEEPCVTEIQLQHWEQIAGYYLCSLGEVMKAALPNGLRKTFTPLTEGYVKLHPSIASEKKLHDTLNALHRAPKQEALLVHYLSLAERIDFINPHETPKKQLLQGDESFNAALTACVKKNIFEIITHEIGRLDLSAIASKAAPTLSGLQLDARNEIATHFAENKTVLLHGVTASGKTEIYIDLMAGQVRQGKQVLYLLPEIALTTQIIDRLQSVFGNVVGVYHSKYNDNERAEIYNAVGNPYQIILGVRSSLFLPFDKLGLIIVDEEHESTYKQYDPAPRYHARDAAIMLAQLHGAQVLLGTATPSIESYYNARAGKYGLVTLTERYYQVLLPAIDVVDMARARKKKQVQGLFSQTLIDGIGDALSNNEQVILFQNRRGYSPFVQCADCGHIPHCKQCSVCLTYHKKENMLVCHYCGATQKMPQTCPECHSPGIQTKGFGTEKAEDELQQLFPQARIARLDLDAARGKNAYSRILGQFAQQNIDILVGTQMVTKGLDFDHVSLVGILNADNMLNFPDFRAHERSYQLMTQVSGRAGRKGKQGRVIIQTTQPDNPVIHLVKRSDYLGLFNQQLIERKEFHFPPYSRLISVTLKHSNPGILQQAAAALANMLQPFLQGRLTGPFQPVVNRIQNKYLVSFWIRLERTAKATELKKSLMQQIDTLHALKGLSGVDIVIDIDPM